MMQTLRNRKFLFLGILFMGLLLLPINAIWAVDQNFSIAYATTVSNGVPLAGAGNIEAVTDRDLYTFTGAVGDVVILDVISGSASTFDWSLDGPTTNLFGGENLADRRVTLTESGSHTLTVEGASGTETGIYSFILGKADVFAYTIGTDVSTDTPLSGMGDLEEVGDEDHYQFTGNIGQRIIFDWVTGSNFRWTLRRPNGTVVTSPDFNDVYSGNDQDVTLDAAGTWTLELNGYSSNNTGPYEFTTHLAPAPQVFNPYNLETLVADGSPVTGMGNLESVGAEDHYQFMANDGDRIIFDWISGSTNFRWTLLNPSSNIYPADFDNVHAYSDREATLNVTGLWTLVINGYYLTDTGTYSFDTHLAPAPQTHAYTLGTPVSDGDPLAGMGNLEDVGAIDRYEFNANDGDTVIFDWLDSNAYFRWTLVTPSSTIFTGFNDVGVYDREETLTVSGLWTLIIEGYYLTDSGSYTFTTNIVPTPQVFTSPDFTLGTLVANGNPVSGMGNIEELGSQDRYEFVGTAGQTIIFDYLSDVGDLTWSLLNPDGTTYDSQLNGTYFSSDIEVLLDQTGTYTLIFQGYQIAGIGTYSFDTYIKPAPEVFTYTLETAVTNGNPTAGMGNIEVPGGEDHYTFSAVPGTQVIFDALTYVGDFRFSLLNPDDTVDSELNQYFNSEYRVTLDGIGTDPLDYTLIVEGYYPMSTGVYSFDTHIVPAAQTFQNVLLGKSISDGIPAAGAGNIEVPGAVDIYEYTVDSAQEVVFDWISNIANGDFRWSLQAPDATWVFQNYYTSPTSDQTVTLNQLGIYKLYVEGYYMVETGYYSFQARLTSQIAPIARNDTYNTDGPPLTISLPGVLLNDNDPNANSMSAVKVSDPAFGTVTLNANGSFVYTPNIGFSGVDGFSYHVSDGTANSNNATVTINVTLNATPPTANNDSYTTPYTVVLNVGAPGLLVNDTNSPAAALLVTQPLGGSVVLNANGSFTYSPNAGFAGNDTFTYRVRNGALVSNTATVMITVQDPPAGTLPGQLVVGGNLDTGTILPTFSWVLAVDAGGNPVPAEWFNIVVTDAADESNIIFSQWFKVGKYCVRLVCAFTPTLDMLPAGLLVDEYGWRVRTWSQTTGFTNFSNKSDFTVDVDAPEVPQNVNVDTSTGEAVISWDDDPAAAWFHVVIKDEAGNVLYDEWHERSEVTCDGSRCSFSLPNDPDNGSLLNGNYNLSISAWGAGGPNQADDGSTSAETDFELVVGDTGDLSTEPGDYYLTNTISGAPTMGFTPAENSTWTLVYLGTNNGGVYTTRYLSWYKVADMSCPNGTTQMCYITPTNMFLPNGEYEWWMVSWGPGGFGAWIQAINIEVEAPAPGLAVPLPMTPSDTLSGDFVTYTWNQVPYITWYQLYVGDAPQIVNGVEDWTGTETYVFQWYSALDICSNGICSVTPSDVYMDDGDYRWYLETYNPGYTGPNWNVEQFGSFTIDRPD